MRNTARILLVGFLFLFLSACAEDCCSPTVGKMVEESSYNTFVKIVVTIITVVIKAILTLVLAGIAVLSFLSLLCAVPIDLLLSLFSWQWIFPLSKFCWCLTIFMKDAIIGLWSAVPPHFLAF